MNAKPILLLVVIGGGSWCIATASAQDPRLDPKALSTLKAQGELAASLNRPYECTLSYKDGGRDAPVRVSAASAEEAQRNAVALATPTGASCTVAKDNLSN